MSDLLYMTRLRWDGRKGLAKLHGRCVVLTAPPELGLRFTIVGMDYVPEVHMCQIMPLGERWRDMLQEEIAAADRVLRMICGP